MSSRRKARDIALMALYQMEFPDSKLSETLKLKWYDKEVMEDEKKFAETIIKGVVENKEELDNLIIKYSKNWQFDRISLVNKSILRMAIYEMLFENESPKIVINEALELTKEFEEKKSVGFINGVLDSIHGNEKKERAK